MFNWLRRKQPEIITVEKLVDIFLRSEPHPKFSRSQLYTIQFDPVQDCSRTDHVIFNGYEMVFPSHIDDMPSFMAVEALTFNFEHSEEEKWFIDVCGPDGTGAMISVTEEQIVSALVRMRGDVASFGPSGNAFASVFPDMKEIKLPRVRAKPPTT